MTYSELSQKTTKQLLEFLSETKKAQMNMRFQRAAGEKIKPSYIRALKLNVARVKTLLNKMKLEEATNA